MKKTFMTVLSILAFSSVAQGGFIEDWASMPEVEKSKFRTGQIDQVNYLDDTILSYHNIDGNPKVSYHKDHRPRKQGVGAERTSRGNAGEPISWEKAYSKQIEEHSVSTAHLNYK